MIQLEALHIDVSWLDRSVNEGFSGGERKRNEVLQLAVLEVRSPQPHPCCVGTQSTWVHHFAKSAA